MNDLPQLLEVLRMREPPRLTLEAQVQALSDRAAIRELIMRYAYLCDARAWDELLDCYTDDVERIFTGTLDERVVGKEAIRRGYDAERPPATAAGGRLADPAVLASRHFLHLIADDVVRLCDGGDEAWACARGQLVVSDEGDGGFRRGSHEASWVFRLRKAGGVWRIAKLVVHSDSAHNPMFQAAGRP